MNQREWTRRFLERRHLKMADGRPLYAYKCHASEYAFAKALIRPMLQGVSVGSSFALFEPIFCLFAAETWRREHHGGVWTWQTVFDAAESRPPLQDRIRKWVSKGLHWWQRPLLEGRAGQTEFLVTIACEGGLPLKLLHNEGTSLQAFFRQLVAAYHHDKPSNLAQTQELARHLALHLPASLRHEVVFQLSARLIASIVTLQKQIGDAPDPIAALDAQHPHWRESLPLPIEDDTIEVLLGNLVRHAQSLADDSASQIRWHRELREEGGRWRIEQTLSLPERVTEMQIRRWTRWGQAPSRLRLLLAGRHGTEAVALLTAFKQSRDGMIYRCESIRNGGVRLVDSVAVSGTTLLLSDGANEAPLSVIGSEPLGPLPWVFVERGSPSVSNWLGEGTAKTRMGSTLVAAASDDRWLSTEAGGHAQPIGQLVSSARTVYRVTGQVAFQNIEGERCRVTCASEEDDSPEFAVRGHYVPWVLNETPLYRGVPSLIRIDREGAHSAVPTGRMEWRPVNDAIAHWSRDLTSCVGRVWLRTVDPTQGVVLFRRQLDVMPSGVKVDYVIGNTSQPGTISLSGFGDAIVRARPLAGLTVVKEGHGITLQLTPNRECSPGVLSLEFCWRDRLPLLVMLPAPLKGAGFFRGGRSLAPGALVAVERLSGIRAVAQGPMGTERCFLDADVHVMEAVDSDLHRLLWVSRTLALQPNGQSHLELFRVQEEIASLLAMVPDINAEAHLTLRDGAGTDLARLRVARFDLSLAPDVEANAVLISQGSLSQLEDGWQGRVTLEMLRLWNPKLSPITLDRVEDEAILGWSVPSSLEPGPWWIIGRDGGWARFRPLLWTVRGETELSEDTSTDSLCRAVREPNRALREALFESAISGLVSNPESTDWDALFAYIRLTREHPANSLDPLRALIKTPEALALALIKSFEGDFELVVMLSEQMPFSWYLIPLSCWVQAAEVHFAALRAALLGVDNDGDIVWGQFTSFRERTASRLPFFGVLCDWLQEQLFPNKPLNGSPLSVARQNASSLAFLVKTEEQEFQSRHDAEERWPQGPRVRELARQLLPGESCYINRHELYQSVLCAPTLAAHICIKNAAYPESVLLELRRLRAFDRNWFDSAFAIHFCLGLAGLSAASLAKEAS